jgi:hypothetical protein
VASIAAEETKIQFRIEGQIGNAISRAKMCAKMYTPENDPKLTVTD